MKFNPASLFLALCFLGLLLLPSWFAHRADNYKFVDVVKSTYSINDKLWAFNTQIMRDKILIVWVFALSALMLTSILHFFGMHLGLAFLLGVGLTVLLIFGLSLLPNNQIIVQNNISNINTTGV